MKYRERALRIRRCAANDREPPGPSLVTMSDISESSPVARSELKSEITVLGGAHRDGGGVVMVVLRPPYVVMVKRRVTPSLSLKPLDSSSSSSDVMKRGKPLRLTVSSRSSSSSGPNLIGCLTEFTLFAFIRVPASPTTKLGS